MSSSQPAEDRRTADDYAIGDAVLDAEDDDPTPATVVNLPPVTCEEWQVGDETVADHNPDHPADAEIVVVAFDDDLAEYAPEWDGEAPLSLAETDVYVYAFPPARLRLRQGEEADREDGPDDEAATPSPAREDPLRAWDGLADLKARLEERHDVEVRREDGEPLLAFDKAGREYRVRPDGSVSDGPFSERIAEVAVEYLGGEA
jgi:hypothetical protein